MLGVSNSSPISHLAQDSKPGSLLAYYFCLLKSVLYTCFVIFAPDRDVKGEVFV